MYANIQVHLLLLILMFLFSAKGFAKKWEVIDEVEDAFGVELIFDTTFQGTWASVSYDPVGDTTRIQEYLQLLLIEYTKYPPGYLNQANVQKLIICENLYFHHQQRAAIPDPYMEGLYLAIDAVYPDNYLVRVMHHELHHSAEYSLYGNMYHKWKKWAQKNDRTFEYGKGGASAYDRLNRGIDYYSIHHIRKGFLNLYATTGEEEDRCEMVAFIMNDTEKQVLLNYCRKDRRLKQKAKLVMKQLNAVSGKKFISWAKLRRRSGVKVDS